mmetsp:Transcript_12275/g.29311  ORF Transcript_12275/g.29311 Transcript_12275/m.29311 type:complete len:530 (+) Transcript_12275:168-1757(+)
MMVSPRHAAMFCMVITSLMVAPVLCADLPALSDLTVGQWNTLEPDSTRGSCMLGGNYSFMVMPTAANPNFEKVLVYFAGGGMCDSIEMCSGALTDENTCLTLGAVPQVLGLGSPAQTKMVSGIMDASNDKNPLKDYARVWVSYCSGDLGWGNNPNPYPGAPFKHMGAMQVRAVLDWMVEQDASPSHVVVSGYSAGGFSALAWAPALRSMYPDATMHVLSDAALSTSSTLPFVRAAITTWGTLNDFLPPQTKSVFEATVTTDQAAGEELMKMLLADMAVNVVVISAVEDLTMLAFWRYMAKYSPAGSPSVSNGQWTQAAAAEVERMSAYSANYSAFIFNSFRHGHVPYPLLYTESSRGTLMVDWLANVLNGQRSTIQCVGCSEAEIVADNAGTCANRCGQASVPAGANNTCSCAASCETEGGCCGDFTSACYPALDIRCGTKTCNAAFRTVLATAKGAFPAQVDGYCDFVDDVVSGLNSYTEAAAVSGPPAQYVASLLTQAGGCDNPCMYALMEPMKGVPGCDAEGTAYF